MGDSRWSVQQVLGLAPDAASVKAARGLTRVSTWSELGCTDSLVFGQCQGSGKNPYQVNVDLTGPAFKCSCPSRKHPCKHGLALLLLWVEHGDAVSEVADAPEAASDWHTSRRERADRPARTAPVDPEAQARRQAEREATMTAGLDDFDRWLADLVRGGLAAVRRQPSAYWDDVAARLVDGQVPALADRVRDMSGLLARPDWADEVTAEIGRWRLAVQAWRRRSELDPATVGDLRAYLGWPWRPDESAAFPTVQDHWVVAGVRQGDDGRIVDQRTWLWGRETRQWVCLLDFAAAGAALKVANVVGSVVADAVRIHPGSTPPRASLSGEEQVAGSDVVPPGGSIEEAVDGVAATLATHPWRIRVPVSLGDVRLVSADEGWWLIDDHGARLAVHTEPEPWLALALTGGRPSHVVGEWERGRVALMSIVIGGAAVPL